MLFKFSQALFDKCQILAGFDVQHAVPYLSGRTRHEVFEIAAEIKQLMPIGVGCQVFGRVVLRVEGQLNLILQCLAVGDAQEIVIFAADLCKTCRGLPHEQVKLVQAGLSGPLGNVDLNGSNRKDLRLQKVQNPIDRILKDIVNYGNVHPCVKVGCPLQLGILD